MSIIKIVLRSHKIKGVHDVYIDFKVQKSSVCDEVCYFSNFIIACSISNEIKMFRQNRESIDIYGTPKSQK